MNNYLPLNAEPLFSTTATKSAVEQSAYMPSPADFNYHLFTKGPDKTLATLIHLIKKHQHQSGWVLLIAPTQLPDKFLAEYYQLRLEKVLVIHQRQSFDAASVIKTALCSGNYAAVINFTTTTSVQFKTSEPMSQRHRGCLYHIEQLNQAGNRH